MIKINLLGLNEQSSISKKVLINDSVDRVCYYEDEQNLLTIDFIKNLVRYGAYDTTEYSETISLLADIIYLNCDKLTSNPDSTISVPLIDDIVATITPINIDCVFQWSFQIISKSSRTDIIDIGVIRPSFITTPPLICISTIFSSLTHITNLLKDTFERIEKLSVDYYGEDVI